MTALRVSVGKVGNHFKFFSVLMMFQFFSLLVPEVMIHYILQEVTVKIQILLRMLLVRHLGTGSLDHTGCPQDLNFVNVNILRSSWVDDRLIRQVSRVIDGVTSCRRLQKSGRRRSTSRHRQKKPPLVE